MTNAGLMIDSVRRRTHLRSQDGMVVPITIMVLAVALVLVGVAATNVNFSHSSSNRDRQAKRAQQAADAGITSALNRMNRLDITHATSNARALQCVGKDATGTLTITPATSGNWCPEITENLGNGESYSYRVRPFAQAAGTTNVQWTVVSTGTSEGVKRRVAVDATALTGAPLFGDYGVISLLDLNMSNTAQIHGNTASNGNINLTNSATICDGTATPGPGGSVNTSRPGATCLPPGSMDTPLVLAPVKVPTTNDNARICVADTCSSSGVTFNATTRRLVISKGSLTLGGSVYVFCQVDMSNQSHLVIPAGARVKIYLDAPERCAGQTGNVGGINIDNNSDITNATNDPTALQVYVAGSSTPSVCSSIPLPNTSVKCAVTLDNRNTSYFTLYAPNSAVTITNNIDIFGAIAAKQLQMSNSSAIYYKPSVAGVTSDDLYPVFKVQGYRECAPDAQSTTDPQARC